VTIENSKIKGYTTGGVLFDDSKGKADGAATNLERSGMKQVGYVKNTLVEGSATVTEKATSEATPQTGIQVAHGATVQITGSKIANNRDSTEPRKAVGVLLTDAETLNGGFSIKGSRIVGNSYGLFNAEAKNEAVREGAPANATNNYWGTLGTPVEGPTVFTRHEVTPVTSPKTFFGTYEEGVSGADAATHPSVLFAPVLGSAPAEPAVGTQTDLPPVGEIVNPGSGEAVEAGVAVEPVVAAEDDYGIRSVSLTANGVAVASKVLSPYVFTWTPTAAEIGASVQLEATITDSGGHVTTSDITVPVKGSVAESTAKEAEATAAKEATEKVAEKKASQEAVKTAESKATAAQEEAKKAREEAAAAKLAATPISTGKVVENTTKGTARLSVIVPSPGELVVSGPSIEKVTGHVTAPGSVQVLITAKGKALETLDKKGKVKVKVEITFTGPEGIKKKTTEMVTLVKK
jgi:hypothetical protein